MIDGEVECGDLQHPQEYLHQEDIWRDYFVQK